MGWEVRARAQIPAPILGMSLEILTGFPGGPGGPLGPSGPGSPWGRRSGKENLGWGGGEPGCPSRDGDDTSIPKFWDHPCSSQEP